MDHRNRGQRNLGGRVRHRGRCGRGHPQRDDPRTVGRRVCTARLEADGNGHWLVNGQPAPGLDGCLDVDLEALAMTNALPVRRMDLPVAAAAAAPAAYVRAAGLAVERLEQIYARTTDQAACQRYDYAAPAFDLTARLVYDESGLVLDHPGIAVRGRLTGPGHTSLPERTRLPSKQRWVPSRP
jgi:Putative glycolipid-binding